MTSGDPRGLTATSTCRTRPCSAWQLRVRFETDDGGSTEESWETTHKRQKMPLEVRMFRKGFDRLEDLSERGVGLLAPSKVGFAMAKIKKVVTVAVIGVGLLAGGLAIWWVNSPPGFTLLLFRNPDNHMGRIPPLTRLETYLRLVPWRLTAPAEVDATVLMVNAQSYACNLSKEHPFGQVQETFDRVEVYETADTVTIETWLGPPEGDGFWPGCKGTGTGFSVRVALDSPMDNRRFVDPACDLDRYARWAVCGNSFDNRWKFGSGRAVDSPKSDRHGGTE